MTPRGACPGVWEPMPSGDGLLVRVKPPGGALPAQAARTLAEASRRWGSGVLELTGRANIQVRGLQPGTVGSFAAAMVDSGLAHPDKNVERRRNVVRYSFGTTEQRIAAAIEGRLVERADLSGLPPKFGFAVGVAGLAGDVWIRVVGGACELGLADAPRVAQAAIDDAADHAIALAHAFLLLRGGVRRMRDLVRAVGAEAVFAAAGLRATGLAAEPAELDVPVGFDPKAGAFGFGLPFGTMSADYLILLAACAETAGDGVLRLTPWRALVIGGVTEPKPLESLPFITGPADPRLRISACPGRGGCAAGSVDTRGLAASLAALAVPGAIHVSGCEKGCAHPAPAALTFVGREGAFDLVRNGRAGDAPRHRALTAAEALAQAAV